MGKLPYGKHTLLMLLQTLVIYWLRKVLQVLVNQIINMPFIIIIV